MKNKERKPSTWTRQRIEELIELYKKQECLWNPWNESYKHKGKRTKAIETICNALHISKPDFAKKIHNLRNQFNSELKKYEKLLEETDELDNRAGVNEYSCRWAHFKSLMFLKDVIAPRPGGTPLQQNKRIRLESSATNSSNAILASDIYLEETNIDNDDDHYEGFDYNDTSDNFQNVTTNTSKDESHNVITLTEAKNSPPKYFTRLHPTTSLQLKSNPQQDIKTSNVGQPLVAGSVIEIDANPVEGSMKVEKQTSTLPYADGRVEMRDQWNAFGECIANEFRNYHSDISRRKLKRKIMQAMLEIGEEDDAIAATTGGIV